MISRGRRTIPRPVVGVRYGWHRGSDAGGPPMPTPRHLQPAARPRRRLQVLAGAALAAAIGTGLLLAPTGGPGQGDAEPTADRSVTTTTAVTTSAVAPTSASTTTASSSTTSVPPTSTTTTTLAGPSGWFAVVQSAGKDGADRDAMEADLAELDAEGQVIDTDDFRTGDGQAPAYYPAPGLLAAVVGPFGALAEVQSWCATYDGDSGCHARQLMPR